MKPQKISDLIDNPRNPRKITPEALAGLKFSIAQFGDLSGITFNLTTNRLVCGHQRLKSLRALYGDKIVFEGDDIKLPTGEIFRVRYVEWDEKMEMTALLAANNEGIQGEWTDDLDSILDEIKDWDAGLFDDLRLDAILPSEKEISQKYTHKIVSPVYEPKGDCPPIESLVDTSKYDQLCNDILALSLPEPIEKFLILASTRHIVFHFGRIAEFFCHQDHVIQDSFEKNALVIIDFDKAIENGFVELTDKLGDLVDIQGVSHVEE